MIHIGAIRKIFRGWRILICAWVDDNSPLKSQFFMLFRGDLERKPSLYQWLPINGNTL